MHEIHSNLLWLGNAGDLREPRQLFDAGIAAVVDVAFEEPPAQLPRQLIYCRFPLNDGGGNDGSLLLQSVQTITDLLAAGMRTIVACSAGMSRSPVIAAFALAAHLNQSPDDVISRIAAIKPLDASSRFWDEVTNIFSQVRRTAHHSRPSKSC